MSKENETKYIFPEIVNGKEDIVGMIAYSFYKLEKMEFIKNNEQVGTVLDNKKLEKFQEFKFGQISEYRIHAEETLKKVIEMTVDEKNKEISELSKKIKVEIEDIEQNKKDFETKKKDLKDKELVFKQKEKELKEREKNLKKQEETIEKRNQICKVKGNGFLYGVAQSIIATILWTILVVLIIKCSNYDIIEFFTGNN